MSNSASINIVDNTANSATTVSNTSMDNTTASTSTTTTASVKTMFTLRTSVSRVVNNVTTVLKDNFFVANGPITGVEVRFIQDVQRHAGKDYDASELWADLLRDNALLISLRDGTETELQVNYTLHAVEEKKSTPRTSTTPTQATTDTKSTDKKMDTRMMILAIGPNSTELGMISDNRLATKTFKGVKGALRFIWEHNAKENRTFNYELITAHSASVWYGICQAVRETSPNVDDVLFRARKVHSNCTHARTRILIQKMEAHIADLVVTKETGVEAQVSRPAPKREVVMLTLVEQIQQEGRPTCDSCGGSGTDNGFDPCEDCVGLGVRITPEEARMIEQERRLNADRMLAERHDEEVHEALVGFSEEIKEGAKKLATELATANRQPIEAAIQYVFGSDSKAQDTDGDMHTTTGIGLLTADHNDQELANWKKAEDMIARRKQIRFNHKIAMKKEEGVWFLSVNDISEAQSDIEATEFLAKNLSNIKGH